MNGKRTNQHRIEKKTKINTQPLNTLGDFVWEGIWYVMASKSVYDKFIFAAVGYNKWTKTFEMREKLTEKVF